MPEALRASSLWQGPADAGGQIGSGQHQEGGTASSMMQRGMDSTSRVSMLMEAAWAAHEGEQPRQRESKEEEPGRRHWGENATRG